MLDSAALDQVVDGYLTTLAERVEAYDSVGRIPMYYIFLDEHYYEARKSRIWMTILEDPLHASAEVTAATPEQKAALQRLSPSDVHVVEVAGQKVQQILSSAPGDGNPIGGIKVIAKDGWFAARPSGTEEIYKIYAESFLGPDHLRRIEDEAQAIVSEALTRRARVAAGS